MRISHEIPKQLFETHDLINDYPYVLAHLLSDKYHYDKEYADFYKEKLRSSEFSILDNSAFELGQSIDLDELYRLGEVFRPTHIVLPDVYGKMKETLELTNHYSRTFGQISTPKFFAVIQGNTLKGYQECLVRYLNNPYIDIIGVTYRTLPDGTTRDKFLEKCFESGNSVLEAGKKLHLLGCGSPTDFLNMDRNLLRLIYSVDTSAPIIHGWNKNRFTKDGCFHEKPKEKLADNLNIQLTEEQKQIIFTNIKHFRNYFK